MRFVLLGALVAAGTDTVLACGSESSTSSSSGSSGTTSSASGSSGASSGGSSGGSSGASSCEIPQVVEPNPPPGCTVDTDCVVRMTGNRCCPQIAQAMQKTVSDANPIPTGNCQCGATPCAPAPVPSAKCGDGGVCVTAN